MVAHLNSRRMLIGEHGCDSDGMIAFAEQVLRRLDDDSIVVSGHGSVSDVDGL